MKRVLWCLVAGASVAMLGIWQCVADWIQDIAVFNVVD